MWTCHVSNGTLRENYLSHPRLLSARLALLLRRYNGPDRCCVRLLGWPSLGRGWPWPSAPGPRAGRWPSGSQAVRLGPRPADGLAAAITPAAEPGPAPRVTVPGAGPAGAGQEDSTPSADPGLLTGTACVGPHGVGAAATRKEQNFDPKCFFFGDKKSRKCNCKTN